MTVRAGSIAAALLLAASTSFAGTAGAVDGPTTQLRVTDAVTIDAADDVPHTVCLDGEPLVDTVSGTTAGPFEVQAATHRIAIAAGHGADCADEDGLETMYVDLVDVPAQTVVLYLEPGPNGPDPAAVVLEDDLSCPADEESRLMVRNVASLWNGLELTDAISLATETELGAIGFVEDLPRGEQDGGDVPAMVLDHIVVLVPPFDETAFADADLDVPAGSLTIRTVYGGLAGDDAPDDVLGAGGGSFDVTIPFENCGDDTPEPTPAPAPTTVPGGDGGGAQPATPVAARPSYTG